MKRLLQSGFGVALLALLVVVGLINTAQLHNLESHVAALEAGGLRVAGTPAAPPAAATGSVGEKAGEICTLSAADEEALNDPANLLVPFRYPENWPASIARGGTLKRQIASEPPGLNLIASNNSADISELYKYITSRIGYQDPTNPDAISPDLALKVTKSEDGLTYDVWLRKGVVWQTPAVDLNDPRHAWLQAPHPLVASDFAFALELIQNPQVVGRAASLRTYFEAWKPIEVVDDHHFRIRVAEDLYTNLPQVFDLEPMPRWLYRFDEDGHPFDDATWGDKQNTHWYNQKGIGLGAYRFVEWQEGVRLTFERNPTYHATKCMPANFDRVEINVMKDQQAWLRNLKTHQLDYTQIMPQQFNAEIRGKLPYLGEEGLKLAIHDEASYYYIGWNATRPLFADKRVRKALTLAFDRAGLVESVFAGLGEVTSGPFDQRNPCYDASIAPLPYDLEAAKALLLEAGWKDTDGDGVLDQVINGKRTPFEFTLVIYGGSTEYETLARVYREALLEIGVKMTAQPLEWAAQLKKTAERDFDAYTGAWVPGWEIDLHQLWHSSQADKPESSNYVSFRSPEGDRIAEALRREFDPEKRTALCHAFHKLIADEQPYTFFYQRKRPMLYWDHMNDPVFAKLNPHRDARLLSFATRPE